MRPSEEKPIHPTLERGLQYYTQERIAEIVRTSTRNVRRWVVGETTPKDAYMRLLEHDLSRDERPAKPDFTFVDLFAGIGGLRRGFESHNGRCVFTSEWDASATTTYKSNFPDSDDIHGDIAKAMDLVPEHDILLAGFPCQPFSLAGVSKKNSLGRAHGFRDKTQGTLFFRIVEILERTKP
jgi:DNA (cytosine-5)-methyltransferase 1